VPENGKWRLCRKLPTIISKEAQRLPITAAFSHTELSGL